MSTAGKYGERQSWRRQNGGEAEKRRTAKSVLTLFAIVLLALFLFILLRPRPSRDLVTLVVAPSYNLDIVTPGMFAESARRAFRDQLAGEVFNESADAIRTRFQDTTQLAKYFEDDDDTLLIVVRGYLLEDSNGEPALACSDLGIDPSTDETVGLLPLKEILSPLANDAPESFSGTRLVLLDVEPLAAHPTLGQFNESVFASLETLAKSLEGPFASSVWVMATRGPMQNVSWDLESNLPLSTKYFIDAMAGQAESDGDGVIELSELCAFMSERYKRLPLNQDTAPELILFRGGQGAVTAQDVSAGELDLWVNRTAEQTDSSSEAPSESVENDSDESGDPPASAQAAAKTSTQQRFDRSTKELQVRLVAAQSETPDESEENLPAKDDSTEPTGAKDVGNESDVAGSDASEKPSAERQTAAKTDAAMSFWDFRDQFESVPVNLGQHSDLISPAALAPQLWRQLTLEVLAAEIQGWDQTMADQTSLQIPSIVTADLEQLLRVVQGKATTQSIHDDLVTKLRDFVLREQQRRREMRIDRRVETADQLQHAIAVAYNRLWALAEFERQAILANTEAPTARLLNAARNAERTLVAASSGQTVSQAVIDRQSNDLEDSIQVFDRNVQLSVADLLREYSRNDPQRSWQLNRAAFAWLRSPLPTAKQRRELFNAIKNAPVDPSDSESISVEKYRVTFGDSTASETSLQRVDQYRAEIADFYSSPSSSIDASDERQWRSILIKNDGLSFEQTIAAILRVSPRLNSASGQQAALINNVQPEPIIRQPSVSVLDSAGAVMNETSAVRLETSEDLENLVLQINPDRPEPTRLLVSYLVRSSASDFRDPPVDVSFSIPGQGKVGPDESIEFSVGADSQRELPIRIRATGVAEPSEKLTLEVRIRGDRTSDQVDGVVGVYRIPLELPIENRLVAVASSYRGIGCSRPTVSGEGSLPGGMWLRTFNDRKTPFQLSLYNESGKACRAKVWLVRLPNPMPPNVRAYWPDFAVRRYSDPVDGRVVDNDGRIEDRYLRPERIVLGPAVMDVPKDAEQVPLNFAGGKKQGADEEAATPAVGQTSASDLDVSHGLALVCRMVDAQDEPLPERDQVIYLVARPWAPRDYVDTKVTFANGRVEVSASLRRTLDGDQQRDEIPELESRPVEVVWQQDDQWEGFVVASEQEPDSRPLKLTASGGATAKFISVPVNSRNARSWVRLNVDGWPRAITSIVDHQPGSQGQNRTQNEIRFGSVTHLKRTLADKTPPPEATYFPRREVYYKGGGEALRAVVQADFSDRDFIPSSQPTVVVEVEGRPYATYQTDRIVKTWLAEATSDGVITLKTTVTDITEDLPQGRYADQRVPITATLSIQGREEASASVTAIMDSTPPNFIGVSAKSKGLITQGATVPFAISAIDGGGSSPDRQPPAGIQRIEFGLDTTGDGQANTQRGSYDFDPPVSNGVAVVPLTRTSFTFPLAQNYHIAVKAFDAAGNEFASQYPVEVIKRSNPSMNGSGETGVKPGPAKKGWLHGKIDTRAGLNGVLTLSPAPSPVNMSSKEIVGQDRSFDFGLLPEGEYTLKFKGSISNKARTLTWEGLKIDTSARKTNPIALDLSEAKSE
ncbi:hypothetical protein LOC67_19175 [Stieleria sp. JC731]|uniref:hypothetical protein n=1 Tax=Pirellulaceae TaxID=2691357 RepID=UPI001E5C6F79|nr:hypothetical protein [Stieleria sp. JC731]MCC9602678.1 hypothetical protein [Stieleria sp. JC731]